MAGRERTYICIDLKSFYASVECTDRGLDPFATDLVVADPERSANTICLAVTPSMKAKGVRNRCRVRDIPAGMEYITAVPRMRRYMEVSAEIYREYLRFVCAEDAWPYSVDECFIDATPYLRRYGLSVRAFAGRLIAAVRERTGIAATAGIGPNMFLAKVALDVTAKHADDGIGELDQESFRREVWFHRPITDIWGIGPGTARRLAQRRIFDLAGVCAERPEAIRKMFGRNGEYLLDHAWGLEPATIADCRSYVPRTRSLSNGQVLMRDYGFDEARTVVREMVFGSCMDLAAGMLACDTVGVWAGYSGTVLRDWDGEGEPPDTWAGRSEATRARDVLGAAHCKDRHGRLRRARLPHGADTPGADRSIRSGARPHGHAHALRRPHGRGAREEPGARRRGGAAAVRPQRPFAGDEPDARRQRTGAQPPGWGPPCVRSMCAPRSTPCRT